MDDGDSSKKAKSHQAHLIPGLSSRQFGFPNSIITKLRYCTTGNLTSTLGNSQYQVFAANGIFDPDITGVGHQPLYRDTYAGIYDQYVVIGSKITFTLVNGSVSPFLAVLVGDDDATISTTADTRMEQNNSQFRLIPANGGYSTDLVCTYEPLMCLGVDAKDDGSSATTVGSNPSQLWCFALVVNTPDTSSATINWAVEIEYTVKFTELATPVQN